MSLLLFTLATAAPAAEGAASSPLSPLVMMALLFGIMYFVMIRPQKRREKERREMVANVKAGEQVVLNSGILGQISSVKENTVMLCVAEQTQIEVVKSAISQIVEKGESPTEIESK